jgi:glycosyltransferase involved in cell wall biosynthesis
LKSLIDVITPCYNDSSGLLRCLGSLDEQSIDKNLFTVNVVDDGSDDSLDSVINQFPALNINYRAHEVNKGLPAALNTALDSSFSRYFIRVDCDDFVHHGFIQSFLWAFENYPDAMAIACDYKKVDIYERVMSYHRAELEPIGCGIAFRRNVIDQIGKYDPEMVMAEDVDFLLRFKKKFELSYIGMCLYRYTQKPGTITTKKEDHQAYIKKAQIKNGVES